MSRSIVICLLLIGSVTAIAQPEVRIYADPFEVVGVAYAYTLKRNRVELTGSFKRRDVPANSYVTRTVGWPNGDVASQAYSTFSDNTWQENTGTLTAKMIRSWRSKREWFGMYYGLYMRCVVINADANKSDWTTSEYSFESTYLLPEENKAIDVFGGLLIGARGKIKGRFFWDVNAGIKVIPWFYTYSKLTYNDGTADKESYQMAGYQYARPGDAFLQGGIGYRFWP